MQKIIIHTDGGCSGNPGPGGWAGIIQSPGAETVLSGGDPSTTNNRMELTAVIRALTEAHRRGLRDRPTEVYTDSQYVKKGITEWIHRWIANGWKNSAKDPVKNRDLWQELHTLATRSNIVWHWIKGHADNPQNNRCDALVQEEIKKILKQGARL